jgi:lipopolysaccharide transport system ATP-binding protein
VDLENVIFSIIITEVLGEQGSILNLSSDRDGRRFQVRKGNAEISMEMPYCGLKAGVYSMKVSLHKPGLYVYDAVESFYFKVKGEQGMSECLYFQPREWLCRNTGSST